MAAATAESPDPRAPTPAGRPRRERAEPRGWPVLGVAPELKRDPPGYLLGLARTHGPVVSFRAAGVGCHLVAHPEGVDHVLRRNAGAYEKDHFYKQFRALMGDGLLTANGARWAASRRIVQPTFTARGVAAVLGEMDREITATADAWGEAAATRDLAAESCAMTLRVLARTLFGELDGERVERVVRRVDELQSHLHARMWSVNPLKARMPSGENRRFARAQQEVSAVVDDLIARAARGETGDGPNIVRVLAEALDPATDAPLSREQLRDEVLTLVFSGHETTGNTLSWLFYVLANNHSVQERVRDEILAVVPPDRTPAMDDFKHLSYTRAVIQEVLRLYPPAFSFARTCVAGDTVMGREVRAGEVVLIAPYVTHRLAEFWPDPDTFRPERFLEGGPAHRMAHIPFGSGPRTCPGGHFAMAEMALTLARVLARVTLQPAASQTGAHEALATLRPRGGMPTRLTPTAPVVRLNGTRRGEHAGLDAAMRLRKRVFVDIKGWPVNVDDAGREHDQFDTRATKTIAVYKHGRVVAAGRAMPLDGPSLLMDVFPWLIRGDARAYQRAGYWEGARLVVDPDLPPEASRAVLARFMREAVAFVRGYGVAALLTVSDPIMERVLKRVGARPERLGPVQRDANGFAVLGLRIPCTPETLAALDGHADATAEPVTTREPAALADAA